MEKEGLHSYRITITLVSVTAILGAQEAAKICWGYLWMHTLCASQNKCQATHKWNYHSDMGPQAGSTVPRKLRLLLHDDSEVGKCDANWQLQLYSEEQFISNLQPLQNYYLLSIGKESRNVMDNKSKLLGWNVSRSLG